MLAGRSAISYPCLPEVSCKRRGLGIWRTLSASPRYPAFSEELEVRVVTATSRPDCADEPLSLHRWTALGVTLHEWGSLLLLSQQPLVQLFSRMRSQIVGAQRGSSLQTLGRRVSEQTLKGVVIRSPVPVLAGNQDRPDLGFDLGRQTAATVRNRIV